MLCTIRNLRVLYIYHGYAVEPLDHAFINLLACLPNLTFHTFYLDSVTALLRPPLLAVARVGRQLECLTVSGWHSIDINLANEDLHPLFLSRLSLHVGSWDIPGNKGMR